MSLLPLGLAHLPQGYASSILEENRGWFMMQSR
uniref:Uncharacterized protein n=1 Tax=Anguilla anguilla TaxID=7936 RepID=A0A0E9U4R8_ANGAN